MSSYMRGLLVVSSHLGPPVVTSDITKSPFQGLHLVNSECLFKKWPYEHKTSPQRYMRRVQDRRHASRDFGSPYQKYNQPQSTGQQWQNALPGAWEQQQQEAQQQPGSVQEQRSSGQPLGNQVLSGQQMGTGQLSGELPGQAQQAQPKRKMAPVPQLKAPREISLPQDVTARQLASLLGRSSITSLKACCILRWTPGGYSGSSWPWTARAMLLSCGSQMVSDGWEGLITSWPPVIPKDIASPLFRFRSLVPMLKLLQTDCIFSS